MVYTPAGRLTTVSFNTNSRRNGSFDQHKLGVWTDNFRKKLCGSSIPPRIDSVWREILGQMLVKLGEVDCALDPVIVGAFVYGVVAEFWIG